MLKILKLGEETLRHNRNNKIISRTQTIFSIWNQSVFVLMTHFKEELDLVDRGDDGIIFMAIITNKVIVLVKIPWL